MPRAEAEASRHRRRNSVATHALTPARLRRFIRSMRAGPERLAAVSVILGVSSYCLYLVYVMAFRFLVGPGASSEEVFFAGLAIFPVFVAGLVLGVIGALVGAIAGHQNKQGSNDRRTKTLATIGLAIGISAISIPALTYFFSSP